MAFFIPFLASLAVYCKTLCPSVAHGHDSGELTMLTVAAPKPSTAPALGAAPRADVTPEIQWAVEQLLYRQADALDGKRWQEFIDLFAPDGIYWMPAEPQHWQVTFHRPGVWCSGMPLAITPRASISAQSRCALSPVARWSW